VNRAAKYATSIVVVHLFVNIAHGLAHRELRIGLARLGSAFVVVVVLLFPMIAMGLVWTTKQRLGFILLSVSMFGALLFGLYHHFLVNGPDHVHAQLVNAWETTFTWTAYGLLITEAIGVYTGIHFLRCANASP
jgi:hypothetical protein